MASTTRRSKAARADRKSDIEERMRQAITTLVSDGERFTELSVERLVAEAGMARSTFYVYFEDKGALLRSIGASTLHTFYEGAKAWFENRGEVTHADVQAAMKGLLEAFHANEVVMAAVAETAVYDPEVGEMYQESVEGFVGAVRKLIVRGQKDGTIRDVHAAETAIALSWMIERTTLQRGPGATPKQIESIATGLADVIWGTLYKAAH